jgi:hypothetical protein
VPLFRPEVAFLGHIVGREGVRTDPDKTEAVRNWATPRSLTDVRSFLGLCSYYRKFVPNFADVAAPMYDLNQKGVPFHWNKEQEAAFQELKDRMTGG